MKYLADTHTHTIVSGHAFSTVDENVRAAAEKGLQLMAVTDHAPGMQHTACHAYFANLQVLPEMLHGVRVLRGIELNILDFNGKIDMDDVVLQRLDIAIASLHVSCLKPGSRKENTHAYLSAMEHEWVDVLGHPGDPSYDIDYLEVFRKAKETGCILEVNNASLLPGGFRKGSEENMEYLLKLCMSDGVPVLVGSDAHFYSGVGDFTYVDRLFQKLHFPEELVLNTDPKRLMASLKRNRKKG